MTDTIYAAFLAQVERDPEALAVIDGDRTATYGELALMADAIAQQLPARASFVGIVMDHGIEMLAAILAVLKIGAAYVPAEPDFPIDRIAFMLGECNADAVITQAAYAERADGRPVVLVERGSLDEAAHAPFDASALRPDQSTPESLAYVLYTSGTTGTPKGVSVENRNVTSYIRAFQTEFAPGPGDRMLQHSVCSFDIFVEEVFSMLLSGGTLVICPKELRDDAPALARFIDEHDVTIVDSFPYLMDALNDLAERLRTVRLYVSGGDVLHASQVSHLVDDAQVYNTYGPSETTCCVAYFRCDGAEPVEDGTYPVGYAIVGTQLDLVDEALTPVAPGEVGEILITGPGVSRGYLGHHPEQANFIVEADGTRRYRSGDMAYRRAEDGALVFLHRKDDQVMIGGKRVEAKEVENVLLQDPAIHQAVVTPGRDEAGFSFLTAYVVPAGDDFSLGALKERLARKLTPFMIPEIFVALDAIPLNSHGKPDEGALPRVLKVGDKQ